MQKSLIFIGILVAVAIGLLVTASKDITTYGTFKEAIETGKETRVVGVLAKDKDMIYEPEIDPNYFSFYITDKDGLTSQVVLKAPKPQDFELSEQVVIMGKYNNDKFEAKDMLMKCPSKYKDEEVYIKSES